MNVLIAEKPSVAVGSYQPLLEKVENEKFTKKDGYLQGNNWIITWCVGHLVTLSMPEDYNCGWEVWSKDNLPMIPDNFKFKVIDSVKKQFFIVQKLVKEASLVVNGADAGREGELIVRLVLLKAQATNVHQKRLWLNSFVMEDMEKGWKQLKNGADYDNLYHSALARLVGDWLVGLNLTRAYSLNTGAKNLSVGRVQTPTLNLIVQRDLEVENWKNKYYQVIEAFWNGVQVNLFRDDDYKFSDTEDLSRFLNSLQNVKGKLIELETKTSNQNPPRPFDLNELQKAANNILSFKASDTLALTQSLYEKKLVTYPRTDSSYLPESMLDDAYLILNKITEAEQKIFLKDNSNPPKFFNSSKVTDHYAIIPTGIDVNSVNLSDKEKKIYELIKNRFVTAFGKEFIYDTIYLAIKASDNLFKGSYRVVKEKGFTALKTGLNEENEATVLERVFNIGDEAVLEDLQIKKKEVTKPKYFTEATLLSAMDTAGKLIDDEELKEAMKERGLGTPATKASIIEILKKRAYISEKGKQLISTTKGRELIKLVDEKIKSPEMTGEWEFKLNQIHSGKYSASVFRKEIESFVRNLITEINSSNRSNEFAAKIEAELLNCPKCKTGKVIRNNAGAFCNQESCDLKIFKKVSGRTLTDNHINDLINKGSTGVIKGFKSKTGKKFDTALKFENWEVVFDFKGAQDDVTVKKVCPKCKVQTVQLKPSGMFCNTENCDFKIWREIAGKKLSDKQLYNLLEKGKIDKIKGFKSKAGKSFDAALELKEFKTCFCFD